MRLNDFLTPEMTARLRERMNALAVRAQSRFRDAVIPIYGAKANGRPVHIGSAVLLVVNGTKAILTAAHVIDQNASATLYGPGRSEATGGLKLARIEGEFGVTAAPGGIRDRDRYDFAFRGLPDEASLGLAGRFIGPDEIAVARLEDPGRLFTALGYPYSKNRTYNPARRSVRASLLPYSNVHRTDAKVAASMPHGGRDHLFLPYGKLSRDEDGVVDHSIGMRGMSGGAVIDAGRPADALFGRPDPEPLLAGIIIELKKRRVLLATRMSAIMPALLAAIPRFGR
jgi:hypothetical protein